MSSFSHAGRIGAGLVLALIGLPAGVASADPGPSSVTLAAHEQPKPARPTLEAIKQRAARDGIPLEQAVKDYISTTAATRTVAASAQPDGPVDTPDVMVDDLHAGEIEDLTRIAAAEGIGLTAAIDGIAWQGQFEKVAAQLEAEFPADFAGAVKNDDSAWFAFKADVPAKAVELARTLPVRVDLVGDRGFSERELSAAAEAAHTAVLADPAVEDAATSYDVRTGTVIVETRSSAPLSAQDLLPRAALEAGMHIQVTQVDKVSQPEDKYIRGGGSLGSCTSGFNLKYIYSSTKRHATAGHCGQSAATRTYSNHSTKGGWTKVNRVWWHIGAWGDLSYYTVGSKSPTRTFYHDWNKTRYADDRSPMPSVGTRICHFGITSGGSCAKVARRDVSSGSMRHMVVMDKDISEPGDSGGPWYYGGMAYGIHFGLIGGKSSFTPAYLYQNRGYDVWHR
ncbi:hypothetical protein [Nonomuraea rhodomycinica]|uniref:Trypsin n=1 Tax=Nonomuraea rhodomycinica TaxID=1712872 RepID=A0A7Y6IVK3_9ACTN|nr:hypothetical protein [Nonomuraea rhodomycinica]NUW44618.1 hypothetical protein [Nonomuraea rhodomycinica]